MTAKEAARAAAASIVAPKTAVEHQKALRHFLELRKQGRVPGNPMEIDNEAMRHVVMLRITHLLRARGNPPSKDALATWVGRVKGAARSRAWEGWVVTEREDGRQWAYEQLTGYGKMCAQRRNP